MEHVAARNFRHFRNATGTSVMLTERGDEMYGREKLKKHQPVGHLTEKEREAKFKGFPSRQVLRATLYEKAMWEITRRFGGEPRIRRKEMARARAQRDYRKLMNLPETR